MKQPVYYLQYDERWNDISYTIDGDKNETIGASGCGPTCMAMVLAEWVDPKITPVETCKIAIEEGHRTGNNGTAWSFFPWIANKYGLYHKQTSITDEAIEALNNGALVICSMAKGYFTSGGHFILAYKYEDGYIYVNDPASTVRTKATTNVFKQQCVQYFILQKAEWKDIIRKVASNPEEWERGVMVAVNAAKADGNLGPLEIFEFLPELIEKVYLRGE